MARGRSAKLPGVMWWELRGKCGGERRRRRAVVREGEALAASLVEGRALAGHVDLSRFSVGQWLVWRGIHEAP